MIQTIKQTGQRSLTKIISLSGTHSTLPYAGGVDIFSVNHNLGYIPAAKMFYQSDDHPDRWFALRTNYDNNIPSLNINTYTKFTVVALIYASRIEFTVTNRDTVPHTLKVVALIYAEQLGILKQ